MSAPKQPPDEPHLLGIQQQALSRQVAKSRKELRRNIVWAVVAAVAAFLIMYGFVKTGLEAGTTGVIFGAVVGFIVASIPTIIVIANLADRKSVAKEHSQTVRQLAQTETKLEAVPVRHGLSVVESSDASDGALSIDESGGQVSLDVNGKNNKDPTGESEEQTWDRGFAASQDYSDQKMLEEISERLAEGSIKIKDLRFLIGWFGNGWWSCTQCGLVRVDAEESLRLALKRPRRVRSFPC